MSDKGTIHIIDDDDAVRESLAFLLESAGMTTKSYPSAPAFLKRHSGADMGCIVTDVRMPQMTGLELIRKLQDAGNMQPIIVITGHGDVPLAVEAMKAGAFDFIEKPFKDDTILAAIERALRTGAKPAADPQAGAAQLQMRERIDALSDRERQVLQLLVAGNSNKEIARDLGISPRTVEVYRANVMSKMQAASLSELVRMALTAGLT